MPEHDVISRTLAGLALLGVALIHVLQLPVAFAEQGYLGGLFIAAAVAAVLLTAALTQTSDSRVWAGAGGLAILILIGYVLYRTVGLPGATDDIGEWDEPPGLASLVVEGLLVCVTAAVLGSRARAPRTLVVSVTAETAAVPAAQRAGR